MKKTNKNGEKKIKLLPKIVIDESELKKAFNKILNSK